MQKISSLHQFTLEIQQILEFLDMSCLLHKQTDYGLKEMNEMDYGLKEIKMTYD